MNAHKGVAVHIREAQDQPDDTYPLVDPPRHKRIPGKYTGQVDDPGLHRIPNTDLRYKDNGDHKNGACYGKGKYKDLYVGLGLPTRPEQGKEDCDEYPFASTVEGAANPDWDFSVKAVVQGQNRSAGSALGRYYFNDRILRDQADQFWVEITDEGEPGPEPSDVVVDAGPDQTGAEESSVGWTIRPVDAPQDATCVFDDPADPQTSLVCDDNGVWEATLTSDDGVDEAISDSALITVTNQPPVFQETGPENWSLYRVGTPVPVTAVFFDAGAHDTHVCTVSWDDGGTEEYDPAGTSCNRTHTFTRAGMFTLNVSVRDDDGGEDTFRTMVVVYDPDAGAANADGSLNVPTGTHSDRPDATGEGWFHLTAKYYRPNDTVPVGTARAWLESAGFRFEAPGGNNLDWLVVTPDGKIAARGSGTVNGTTDYGFVVYGNDGCDNGLTPGCRPGPDKFRTVVWRGSQNDPDQYALYDTNRGADFDLDDALPTPLGSGQITIQR